jgi:hypothetical protein
MQAASQKAILLALGSQTQAEIAAAAQSRLKKIARFAGPRKGLDPSSASAAGAAGQSQTQSHCFRKTGQSSLRSRGLNYRLRMGLRHPPLQTLGPTSLHQSPLRRRLKSCLSRSLQSQCRRALQSLAARHQALVAMPVRQRQVQKKLQTPRLRQKPEQKSLSHLAGARTAAAAAAPRREPAHRRMGQGMKARHGQCYRSGYPPPAAPQAICRCTHSSR